MQLAYIGAGPWPAGTEKEGRPSTRRAEKLPTLGLDHLIDGRGRGESTAGRCVCRGESEEGCAPRQEEREPREHAGAVT